MMFLNIARFLKFILAFGLVASSIHAGIMHAKESVDLEEIDLTDGKNQEKQELGPDSAKNQNENKGELSKLKDDLGVDLDYISEDANKKVEKDKDANKNNSKERNKKQSQELDQDKDKDKDLKKEQDKDQDSSKVQNKDEDKESDSDNDAEKKEKLVAAEYQKNKSALENIDDKAEDSSSINNGNKDNSVEKENNSEERKTPSSRKGMKEISISGRNAEENVVFDVGKEEKELLKMAKGMKGKIPEKEWSEIAAAAKSDKYVVVEKDTLWDISKRFFGSGFYYGKLWSLNSFITNPHEIKPKMVLVFDTGDSTVMPQVQVGSFENGGGLGGGAEGENIEGAGNGDNGDKNKEEGAEGGLYGDESSPAWIKERQELKGKGGYIQYATDKTYDDLKQASEVYLNKEYDRYEPPATGLVTPELSDNYDQNGFSKDSRIAFNFKEGYSIITFVTSNLVQDLGEITASATSGDFFMRFQNVFLRLNSNIKASPGDKYSVYVPAGKVTCEGSDRSGYKYVIVGELQLIRKVSDQWEAQLTDVNGVLQRGSRITIHTPKIKKLIRTFNDRTIEGMVVAGHSELKNNLSYGDVAYIDRGRADGVEVGNVFDVYSGRDGLTDERITIDPTYKIGELTVLTLTDNFATVLVTNSSKEIPFGTLAVTKTKAQALLAAKLKEKKDLKAVNKLEDKALSELDVELNLDNINKKVLEDVDKVELSESEMSELDREEREKSFIEKEEKDLKELERIEKDIETAEGHLKSSKTDEDKVLQDQDLDDLEKKTRTKAKELLDSLNEIEKKEGKKYLDEDLNSKENPYGLSNFDLEEIDELMNTNTGPEKSK